MMNTPVQAPAPVNGLILPGGGARAAYQVGVLKVMAEMLPADAPNPFPVITGTSAGSINAAVLAERALDFHLGVRELTGIWENVTVDEVFRTDLMAMMGNSLSWLWALIRGRLGRQHAHSFLDTSPLRDLLERHIRFARIQQAVDCGALQALAITASGYTSASSISFFQGRDDLNGWVRSRRQGRRADITLDHIMASVAIPLVFPAVRIGQEYFGDGAIRQGAPLSPAVHLGATRILVIGLRNDDPNELPEITKPQSPGFGQIMGYMLDTLFMDRLAVDLERLERINALLKHVDRAALGSAEGLIPIDATVLVPSADIRDIVHRYTRRLPHSVKFLLRSLGGLKPGSRQLVSYLMFDSGFCRELIELGYADGKAQRDKLLPFVESGGAGQTKKVLGGRNEML